MYGKSKKKVTTMSDSNPIINVSKTSKITKKQKLAMMNLNVVLAAKSHQSKKVKTILSHKGKIDSPHPKTGSKGPPGLASSSSSSSTSSSPSHHSSSSASTSSANSSISSTSPSCASSLTNDSIEETINDVVKSVCPSIASVGCKTTNVFKIKSSTDKKKSMSLKGFKVSELSASNAIGKNGDSIDEAIESVLKSINKKKDVNLGENTSAGINTSSSSILNNEQVTKKINLITDKSMSATIKPIVASNAPPPTTPSVKSERPKKIHALYEEDIVDGFAIHSFLTYSDMKRNVLVKDEMDIFDFDDEKLNDETSTTTSPYMTRPVPALSSDASSSSSSLVDEPAPSSPCTSSMAQPSSVGHPLRLSTPPIPSQGSLPSTAPSKPATPTIGSSSVSVVAPSCSASPSSSPLISESILQSQDLRREPDERFLVSQDKNLSVPPPPYMTRPVPALSSDASSSSSSLVDEPAPSSPCTSSMAPPSSIGHPLSLFTPPIPSQVSLPSTAPSRPPTPTIGSASGSVVAPSCTASPSSVKNSSSPFISESILQNQDLLRRELDERFLASQDRNISVPPPPYMTRPVPGLSCDASSSSSLLVDEPSPSLPFTSSMAPPPLHLLDKLSRLDPSFYGRIPGNSSLPPILTSTASGTIPATNLQDSSGSTSSSLSSSSEAGGLMLGPHPSNCVGSSSSSGSSSKSSSERASGTDSTLFGPPGHLAAFQPKSASISITAEKSKSSPKSGRWCAMHVRIAWEIYHHQQKSGLSLHQSNEPNSSSSSTTTSSSSSLHQHPHAPPSHFKPSLSSSSGSLVHSIPTSSSVAGSKSSPHSSVNSGVDRSNADSILRPLNHNHNSLPLHPFSRSSELPFTTSLLSAAAGHATNSAIRPMPPGYPGHPMDPYGPLASLNPYSRSPFGPFGNPFLTGLAPLGHASSLLSHQSSAGMAPPTAPAPSSLLNDSWMRSMAGTPRPGSTSHLGYPAIPPPLPPSVIPPTSSSSSNSAAGSAWGGLRAEADRADVRGGSSSSGYMSPHHHLPPLQEKRKDESKSVKSHSKSSKSTYDGVHHTTNYEGSSTKHHEKRVNGDRNGDHYGSKNWDMNKINKRERSPSSHSYSSPSKYQKYGSSHDPIPPFNQHPFNSHLSMMSNMSGLSAYGMSHGNGNGQNTKSGHHNETGSKSKSSHNRSDDREDIRKSSSSSSSSDRPKSSSINHTPGDHNLNAYLDKRSSLSSTMTPSYREALEMELSKNPLLGFPPPSSPYSSSSALAAMSMASPLERARLMGMFGLPGPGSSSPFMSHPSAMSGGYPGMDPLKSLWASGGGGSPFLPPLPGMGPGGLHSHLDPFKSLHEFPSRMPEFLEREHILARYNILNSHGGGAPLTDKLKDNSTASSSTSSSISGSSSSSSSSSGQIHHTSSSAATSSSASSGGSSSIMDHKLGSLGLVPPPPPPASLLPPLPPTAGLLPPPPLLPPLLPPPSSSLLGLGNPAASSSSSLSMTPTLPTL